MKTYTAPIFVPIKLEGTTVAKGSCHYTLADINVKPAFDADIGFNLFGNSTSGCEIEAEQCYSVPYNDSNIHVS